MFKESLKVLYDQYRACINKEIVSHSDKQDHYEPYTLKCAEQREDIYNFYTKHFNKYNNALEKEELLLQEKEAIKTKLNQHGWNEQQMNN